MKRAMIAHGFSVICAPYDGSTGEWTKDWSLPIETG